LEDGSTVDLTDAIGIGNEVEGANEVESANEVGDTSEVTDPNEIGGAKVATDFAGG